MSLLESFSNYATGHSSKKLIFNIFQNFWEYLSNLQSDAIFSRLLDWQKGWGTLYFLSNLLLLFLFQQLCCVHSWTQTSSFNFYLWRSVLPSSPCSTANVIHPSHSGSSFTTFVRSWSPVNYYFGASVLLLSHYIACFFYSI